jgi:hypothetical protein
MAGPPPSEDLTTPSISCLARSASSITLQVCGTGTYGAPGGFSIHMKTKADWLIDGWDATGSYTCLSLGGNCQGGSSQWSLGAGECVSVVISATTVADYAGQNICGVSSDCGIDPLLCGTDYVFRVFAHADGGSLKASEKGPEPPLTCSTAPCPPTGECTLTWGYWKTHGPEGCSPGNQANDWNLNSIPVGGLSLSQADACAIMHDSPNACGKGGGANGGANAVLILEHQLIAAELNVAEGAINCAFANQAIVAANAILAGKEYDCVGASTVLGQQMIAIKDLLAAYNDDQCACPTGAISPETSANAPSNTKKASWGGLKSIYR